MIQSTALRTAGTILAGILLCAAPIAWGGENDDLGRIPDSFPQPTESSQTAAEAPVPTNFSGKFFIEDAVSSYAWRTDLLVPPPPSAQAAWQERLSFDLQESWTPSKGLHLIYSGRLNLFAQDDIIFPSDQTIRHDFREGYASWEAVPQNYLDAGRINLKSGVAVGFNPTDFFKTRAVVDLTSQDPSVLRENRLGTLMARGQSLWEGGSLTVAYAPSAFAPHAIYNTNDLPSFDPMFDRTNSQQRVLVKTSFDLSKEFSPEFLVYQENTRTSYGTNLTYGIGDKVIVYSEWAGSNRASLAEEAYQFGLETGTFPSTTPRVFPGNRDTSFKQDLAAGASYSTESKVTIYLEYDYHEAGFSREDWKNWFAVGQANRNFAPVAAQLWYIRFYALDQQEPLNRESAFLRASWNDAFVTNLDLTGFVSMNLYDDSSIAQISATYHPSDHWSFGALGLTDMGTEHTERGSLPLESSFLVKVTRYF